jgi:hypothetical protein
MTAILDLVAQPHSSNPSVHTGFSTALYMRSLFFNDRVKPKMTQAGYEAGIRKFINSDKIWHRFKGR